MYNLVKNEKIMCLPSDKSEVLQEVHFDDAEFALHLLSVLGFYTCCHGRIVFSHRKYYTLKFRMLHLLGVKEVKGVRGVKAECNAGVKTPLHS